MVSMLACALAQTPDEIDRTATSSIRTELDKNGKSVITTVNRKFRMTEEPCPLDAPRDYLGALLLLEEFSSRKTIGMEGQEGIVRVEAWVGRNAKVLKRIWEFQQEGDGGGPFNCFYKVSKFGCCALPSTDVFYSLITGNKVFTSNSPLFGVVVPNTSILLDRYFAYLMSGNSLKTNDGAKPEDLVAVIQYGSETEALHRIAIRSKIAGGLPLPKISFLYRNKLVEDKDLMLWGVDGKNGKSSLSNFALVLSYDWAGEIVIPVSNDTPDIGKATVSKKFWLESVPVPSRTAQGPDAKSYP